VESVPGRGSTFTVDLPLARIPDAAALAPATAAAPSGEADFRVLVAEDNQVNQLVVKTLLNQLGIDLVMVENGALAVEAWRDGDFDAILMDIQMPEMDGLQATAELREREGRDGNHIPIVAMTAHAMAGDRERCLDAGMDGYIAKPIHPGELMALITGMTAQKIAVGSIRHS
jgi:CheY-like chemotaxis protein